MPAAVPVKDKFKCNLGDPSDETIEKLLSMLGYACKEDLLADVKIKPDSKGKIKLPNLNTKRLDFTVTYSDIFDEFYDAREGHEEEKYPGEPRTLSESIRNLIKSDATKFFWLAVLVTSPWDAVCEIYRNPRQEAIDKRDKCEKQLAKQLAKERATAASKKGKLSVVTASALQKKTCLPVAKVGIAVNS
jgi:hypothetical protein